MSKKKPTQTVIKVQPSMSELLTNLFRLQDLLKLAGYHPSILNPVKVELANKAQALPIDSKGCLLDYTRTANGWEYFILFDGKWIPAHGGQELKEGALNKSLAYYTIQADGTHEERGIAHPYEWCHCDPEGKPEYHWVQLVQPPLPCPMEGNALQEITEKPA